MSKRTDTTTKRELAEARSEIAELNVKQSQIVMGQTSAAILRADNSLLKREMRRIQGHPTERLTEKEVEAGKPISSYLVHLKYDDHGRTFRLDPEGVVDHIIFKSIATDWISQNLGVKNLNWKREAEGLYERYGLTQRGHVLHGLSAGTGVDF